MDDLLDLVLGILFEGALEAAGSRRVPLPVPVSLWVVVLAFMAGIVGLVAWVGAETGRPGLLVLSAAMLGFGWLYHMTMGGEALAVDIGLYVVLMAVGFLLPELLSDASEHPFVGTLSVLAVLALAAAMILFTFLPPDHHLFLDLSGVNTWSTIPY